MRFAYGNGFFLAIYMVVINLLNVLFLALIMNAIFLGEKTHSNFVNMAIGFSGYACGVIFTSIFFRECVALTSRGVEISCDLIIRNDR